jgi:hypothetical protein
MPRLSILFAARLDSRSALPRKATLLLFDWVVVSDKGRLHSIPLTQLKSSIRRLVAAQAT